MKIALVSLSEDKYWQSCYLITNGLRDAYLKLGRGYEIQEWRLSRLNSRDGVHKIASQIVTSAPDMIVFIDTSPLFGIVLKRLREGARATAQKHSQLPQLRFHVYGDFTMRSHLWESWENDLKSFTAEWVCASNRQRNLVSALTNDEAGLNWVCPFPVIKTGVRYDPAARAKVRKELGFRASDFVIYYAGRLALQKNVLAILHLSTLLERGLRERAQFVFAGDFDDHGAPFNGMSLESGQFYCIWQATLAKLPADLRKRVHVLGGLDHDCLQSTYSAADCFLSLSLQHDEDFGMAPAEAGLAGLPMVLTDWGGYADFKTMGADASMVSVHLSESGPGFDIRQAAAAIERFATQPRTEIMREKCGRMVAAYLSPNATTELVKGKTSPRSNRGPLFKNFSPVLKDVSTFFDESKQHLIYPDRKEGSTYEQIYQHYI